jgi:ribosomal protein S18 acetylase RimI-like enzyme
MGATVDSNLCEQVLRSDETNLAYFSTRADVPGATLFCAERDDAPEFDVAVIYRVPADDADATLRTIIDFFQRQGRRPRIRLSPMSSPADWPCRLQGAGFVETDERFLYILVPETLHLPGNPAVRIERAVSLEDADRFSAIQVAGFDVPVEHQGWDQALARRHLAADQHNLYLAWLDGRAVGSGRSIHLAGGVTAMAALATLPEARGRGVGVAVLRQMIQDARLAGSQVIFWSVMADSYAAGMYSRLGFATLFQTRSFEAADVRRHPPV